MRRTITNCHSYNLTLCKIFWIIELKGFIVFDNFIIQSFLRKFTKLIIISKHNSYRIYIKKNYITNNNVPKMLFVCVCVCWNVKFNSRHVLNKIITSSIYLTQQQLLEECVVIWGRGMSCHEYICTMFFFYIYFILTYKIQRTLTTVEWNVSSPIFFYFLYLF